MKKILNLAIAVLFVLTGCASSRSENSRNHIDLIEYAPGKIDVRITRRQWGGFWGPEGYIGYEKEHYRAGLRGSGRTFTNPEFQDNPPGRCIGTITLDREHNKVIVNMWRVVSKPGEPLRTKAHPANGTYPIASTRKATPGEPS